jgi:hypothetical protein
MPDSCIQNPLLQEQELKGLEPTNARAVVPFLGH